jgi:tRNA1(Val) A37 N6-methylase TrmN6
VGLIVLSLVRFYQNFDRIPKIIVFKEAKLFLYQPSNGYRYNSDSIFLYDFIRSFDPKGEILDVGCGVGIVGLLAARDFSVKMTAIDKQKQMTEYAARNYDANDLNVEVHTADFADFDVGEKYDYIVSNPPFYDSAVTQSNNEQINIARYTHHLPINTFVKSAKRLLKQKAYLIFCYDAKQIDKVLFELKVAKLNPEVIRFVHPKIDREAKIALIAARANSKSMVRVLPPMIVFDDESNYMPDAQAAFDIAATNVVTANSSPKEL